MSTVSAITAATNSASTLVLNLPHRYLTESTGSFPVSLGKHWEDVTYFLTYSMEQSP
jgi:hypothetical protein